MSDKFAFLTRIKLREDIKEAVVPFFKNPTGPRLRVFKNGKVFPSEELVKEFNMEYNNPDGETSPGNGIDFFKSTDWTPYPKEGPTCLIVAFIPRTEPKIDLFAGAKSDKTSVLSQGPKSEELVNLLQELYPHDWNEGYIDIAISVDTPIQTENNIYLIPKKLKRGPKTGERTYVRRESIKVFPCEPWSDGENPSVERVNTLESLMHQTT